MADRSSFWKMVDRTTPSKLRVFPESELRECEDYFLEIQSDSTLPPNEIITASERLALLRSEIYQRHSDAKHRQTQRLARWAIGFGMVSVVVAITSGVAQWLANKPTRHAWPVAKEAPTVATPKPMQLPTATAELTAAPPTATPELSAAPTPRRTPTEQRRKKRRTRRETMRKTDSVAEFLRSLFRAKPTPRNRSKYEG
jgi:hypothetical protein